MNEKINKIFIIMNNYINKYSNVKIVDYYDLFQINRNSTLEEIKNIIKKLKIILHPDWEAYLPEFMQNYYLELLEEFGNCEKSFSNKETKALYDKSLQKEKDVNGSDFHQNSSKEEDVTEFEFDSVLFAIKITTQKHGFDFVLDTLTNTFLDSEGYKWETRFSKESRANITKIGLERFKEVVKRLSKKDSSIKENIIDWFSYLYKNDKEINSLIYPIEKACYFTASKYGEVQLKSALLKYYKYGDAQSFTRKDNSRNLLKEKIEAEKLSLYMEIYLNSYKDESEIYKYRKLSFLNFDNLLQIFVDKFLEEINNYSKEENDKKYYK